MIFSVGRHSVGVSIAWLGARGIPYDAVVERLGLVPTGEFADYAEHAVSARQIPDGWSLVVARRCDHRIIAEQQLSKLAVDCEVVACSIEEHVMYSSSELWLRGKRQWRVVHDAQESIDHLSTSGSPPQDFPETRARFAGQQEAEGGKSANVDFYFEIPLVLAQTRVGFKHDEASAFDADGKFHVLADPSRSRNRSWWRFWR